ncbi:unnamed protein product [Prunus armeniaca]
MNNAESSSAANDELLTVTEEKCNGDVVARDKTSCDVLGLGTMKIKMQDGVVGSLTEVRNVLALRMNHISLGALDRERVFVQGQRIEAPSHTRWNRKFYQDRTCTKEKWARDLTIKEPMQWN